MNRRKSLEIDHISTQEPNVEISFRHRVCAYRKGSNHRRNHSRSLRRANLFPLGAAAFSPENNASTTPLKKLPFGPDDLPPGVNFPSTRVRSGGDLAGKPNPGAIK